MRKLPRNNLSSFSQDWARRHEDSIRELDADVDFTSRSFDNFSREYHGALDGLNSDVLFLSNRKMFQSPGQTISASLPPSTEVERSFFYTFSIPTVSRFGFVLAETSATIAGSPVFGIGFAYFQVLLNGQLIASSDDTTAGGVGPILGDGATNLVEVKVSTYNFTGTTYTVNLYAKIYAQVR